jgi:hypothetical protein
VIGANAKRSPGSQPGPACGASRVRPAVTHSPTLPAHASRIDLVGIGFGIVERQAMRRGASKSVGDLNAKIRLFI